MPDKTAYMYGALYIDNFIVKIPVTHTVSFNINDDRSNAVNGARVTVYGADGSSMTRESVSGRAEFKLPRGDYTYTVDGFGASCTSITNPKALSVGQDDITEEIPLIAFDGRTPNRLVLSDDAGKDAKAVTYTAQIKDQFENIMSGEKIKWTVVGADSFEISGDTANCTVTVPEKSPSLHIAVTAESARDGFGFLYESRDLDVAGYPFKVIFKNDSDVAIQIPDEGSIHRDYSAVVVDSDENPLQGGVVYELTGAPYGVSIDGVTGVLTVTSDAKAQSFAVKAASSQATEVYSQMNITLTHDAPSGLMVDLRQNPAGVSKTPKFSWIVNSPQKNSKQTAYQILVSSTHEKSSANAGDVWNSGKVRSGASTGVAYGGPALSGGEVYYWKVKTWDNHGNTSPYSTTQRFFTANDEWTATAVWTPSDKPNVIFARRSFNVEKPVSSALLNITASSNSQTRQFAYRAYINGDFVGLGPQFLRYDDQYYYNSFDVTDYIVQDENVLGAICYALSDKKLMAELKINYADGTTETIATDGSWKVLDGTASFGDNGTDINTNWYYTAMAENINANFYPYGWNEAGYDAALWSDAAKKGAIPNLVPASVDVVGEYEVSPVNIVGKSDGWFIDLGKEITGGIELSFTGIDDPKVLDVRYGEELSAPRTVKYNMRTGNVYREYFIMKTGDQTFKNFGMKSFRYIEILNCPFEITKDNIKGIAIRQAFDDEESYFVSDNELLDSVYDFCKYSIKATTQDMLVDSQTRERGPYEGDLYVNQLSMYSFMRNYNVARFTNEALAYNPNWCMEYHQMTVMSAWEDYIYTGDASSLEKLYDALRAKLLDSSKFSEKYNLYQWGKMGSGGNGQVLVDWPDSQRDGYVSGETDYNTVLNAFHYAAASNLAKIAAVLGKTDDASYYRDLSEKIKNGMQSLYVSEKRRFADAMRADGTLTGHCSQHASFFPLALGVVDDENIMKDLAAELGKDGIKCSIYATQFLLSGLYNAGDSSAAEGVLTSTADKKSWYYAMNTLGATIVPECWDPSQKSNMTMSHAWGSSPANIIVRYLCGILPLEAGWSKIKIRPSLGDLKKAKVKTPCIKGYVYMSIDAHNRTMNISIPANTTADVYVPFVLDKSEALYMDGVKVKASENDGYYAVADVGSGAHTFTAGKGRC